MIRLLAIDIDGTLLDSQGRVPRANLDAIHRAAGRGVRIVIATGRSFHFARQALGDLPDDLTLLAYNGAIARSRIGETLLRRLLPKAVARQVLEATVEWRTDTACVFDRPLAGQFVYDRMDWSHANRAGFKKHNAAIIQAVDRLEEAVTEDPVQVTFNGGVQTMRAISALLAAHPVAPHLEVTLTEYPKRDFSLVDVCRTGTTKGTGLAALAGHFGVEQAEVMAVGDNHNDRDMLEWAGTGVVMGNAEPELKIPGFHLTGTNDEAGLTQAIDLFIP